MLTIPDPRAVKFWGGDALLALPLESEPGTPFLEEFISGSNGPKWGSVNCCLG
jgi:hypothetical protein